MSGWPAWSDTMKQHFAARMHEAGIASGATIPVQHAEAGIPLDPPLLLAVDLVSGQRWAFVREYTPDGTIGTTAYQVEIAPPRAFNLLEVTMEYMLQRGAGTRQEVQHPIRYRVLNNPHTS